MRDWAVIHLPTLITAVFIVVAVVAVVLQLALDRIRRLEDRATLYQTLLDKHGITYPKEDQP
jgi:hypothetical protein